MQRSINSASQFLNSVTRFFHFFSTSTINEPSDQNIRPPSETQPLVIQSLKAPPSIQPKEQKPIVAYFDFNEVEKPVKFRAHDDYSQGILLEKLNQYLVLQNRQHYLDTAGYCHGLTLLWLYKMTENQEEWFYSLVKKIIDYPEKQLLDIEMSIEKFLNHIEWMQNPHFYHANWEQEKCEELLEVKKLYSTKAMFSYSKNQLKTLFNKYVKDNVMIVLASAEHTIGVIQRGFSYYIYDANYRSGRAKEIPLNDFNKLFSEIFFGLYERKIVPTEYRLFVHISRVTRQRSLRLMEKEQAATIRNYSYG